MAIFSFLGANKDIKLLDIFPKSRYLMPRMKKLYKRLSSIGKYCDQFHEELLKKRRVKDTSI